MGKPQKKAILREKMMNHRIFGVSYLKTNPFGDGSRGRTKVDTTNIKPEQLWE